MRFRATEQTVSWFYQRQLEESLTLRPPFQRRLVWTRRQQSNLIESILLGLPIPEIYLQSIATPTGRTNHIVVDGQQRITALLQFIGLEEDPGFELDYLNAGSPYLHRTFRDLTDEEKTRFFGYSMAVRELWDTTDAELQDLFLRINTFIVKLNNQELRNATYSGPFVKLSEDLATDDFWLANKLLTATSIRRMNDVEFASDLLIGVMHGPQGGDAKTIDEYYANLEEYEDEFPDQPFVRRTFQRTRDLIEDMFPDLAHTRWHNKTDFYTLFVALANMYRGDVPHGRDRQGLRERLDEFAGLIEAHLGDPDAAAPEPVQAYVRAVQRGSSDKYRRALRHQALLAVIQSPGSIYDIHMPRSVPTRGEERAGVQSQ